MNFKIVYELLEVEYYEDQWNSIGLFESKDLLEEFLAERKKELKINFDIEECQNDFNDWYKWMVREKKFYVNA
jgi:hypothetical protein